MCGVLLSKGKKHHNHDHLIMHKPPYAAAIIAQPALPPQPIVAAWSTPLLERFANTPQVALYNMVFVDALVFRTWPMRWIIARPNAGPPTQLYYFDNDQDVRNALQMRNLLSGCVVRGSVCTMLMCVVYKYVCYACEMY